MIRPTEYQPDRKQANSRKELTISERTKQTKLSQGNMISILRYLIYEDCAMCSNQ